MEQERSISRRGLLKYAGGSVAAFGAVGAGTVLMGQDAHASLQVETEHLEVTTPNGRVEEITVNFQTTCSYSNVGPEVTHLGFTSSLNGETLFDEERSIDHDFFEGQIEDPGPDSGTVRLQGHNFDDITWFTNLFEWTSFEPSDFEVPEDGASETFPLELDLEFRVISHGETVVSSTASATAQLTIHNEVDDDGGGGGGGGDGGSDPTPTPEASMEAGKFSIEVELPSGETVRSS